MDLKVLLITLVMVVMVV